DPECAVVVREQRLYRVAGQSIPASKHSETFITKAVQSAAGCANPDISIAIFSDGTNWVGGQPVAFRVVRELSVTTATQAKFRAGPNRSVAALEETEHVVVNQSRVGCIISLRSVVKANQSTLAKECAATQMSPERSTNVVHAAHGNSSPGNRTGENCSFSIFQSPFSKVPSHSRCCASSAMPKTM